MITNDAGGPARFLTTRWTLVAAAAVPAAGQRESLARLCELYWQPVYVFIRRHGVAADDARDLTQEFFATLLEKNFVRAADPARGRFRSFLLASVKHFLSNRRDRDRAQKRGGGAVVVSLDGDTDEQRFRYEPATAETPDRLFEQRWARAVLARAFDDLRAEQERAGRQRTFAVLEPYLSGADRPERYRAAAATLGSTEGAVRVAVHRLRRRFRTILLDHISQTVTSPSEIDGELRHLAQALQPIERVRNRAGYA